MHAMLALCVGVPLTGETRFMPAALSAFPEELGQAVVKVVTPWSY